MLVEGQLTLTKDNRFLSGSLLFTGSYVPVLYGNASNNKSGTLRQYDPTISDIRQSLYLREYLSDNIFFFNFQSPNSSLVQDCRVHNRLYGNNSIGRHPSLRHIIIYVSRPHKTLVVMEFSNTYLLSDLTPGQLYKARYWIFKNGALRQIVPIIKANGRIYNFINLSTSSVDNPLSGGGQDPTVDIQCKENSPLKATLGEIMEEVGIPTIDPILGLFGVVQGSGNSVPSSLGGSPGKRKREKDGLMGRPCKRGKYICKINCSGCAKPECGRCRSCVKDPKKKCLGRICLEKYCTPESLRRTEKKHLKSVQKYGQTD